MPTEIEGVKLFTVQETAKVLGVTDQTVRRYVENKRLKGQRIGRPVSITAKSLHAFLNISEEEIPGRK
jgi:excisionase family DNA binding protein